MKKLLIIWFIFLAVYLYAGKITADALSEKYRLIMDGKDSGSKTDDIEKNIIEEPFTWDILKNKLTERNFTNDQKLQVFYEYYENTGINSVPLDIIKVIKEDIPFEIKKTLITSNRINFLKDININYLTQLRKFGIDNDCIECIEKSNLIGNRKLNIKFPIENIHKYQILDTYYFTPVDGKDKFFAFLDDKKDGVKFGIGDVVEANCHTTFHEEQLAFIFWHCRLNKVNNTAIISINKNKIKKYHVKKDCGSIKIVQKKLDSHGINVGKIDGQFGQKLFFALFEYNSTGDLDDATCKKLDTIQLPTDVDEYEKEFVKEKISLKENNSFPIDDSINYKDDYSIQIAAISNLKKARKLQQVMLSEGYNSYIEKTQKDNLVFYRVKLESYSSIIDAKHYHKIIKKRYLKNTNISNSIIVKNDAPVYSNNSNLISNKSLKNNGNILKRSNLNFIKTRGLNISNLYKNSIYKYSIQISAISNKTIAKKIVIEFRNLGYKAYIMEYNKLFRIRIGDTNNRNKMVNLLSSLKADFGDESNFLKDAIIINN